MQIIFFFSLLWFFKFYPIALAVSYHKSIKISPTLKALCPWQMYSPIKLFSEYCKSRKSVAVVPIWLQSSTSFCHSIGINKFKASTYCITGVSLVGLNWASLKVVAASLPCNSLVLNQLECASLLVTGTLMPCSSSLELTFEPLKRLYPVKVSFPRDETLIFIQGVFLSV